MSNIALKDNKVTLALPNVDPINLATAIKVRPFTRDERAAAIERGVKVSLVKAFGPERAAAIMANQNRASDAAYVAAYNGLPTSFTESVKSATRTLYAWKAATALASDAVTDDTTDGLDLSGFGLEDGESFFGDDTTVTRMRRGVRVAIPTVKRDGKDAPASLPHYVSLAADAFGFVGKNAVRIDLHRRSRPSTKKGTPRPDMVAGSVRFTRPNGAEYVAEVMVIPSKDSWLIVSRVGEVQ